MYDTKVIVYYKKALEQTVKLLLQLVNLRSVWFIDFKWNHKRTHEMLYHCQNMVATKNHDHKTVKLVQSILRDTSRA